MAEKENELGAIAQHPVQAYHHKPGRPAYCSPVVTLRAYEVYCAVYGPQEAMVTGSCRGGFATSELIAFLYARSFPKDQWSARVKEAFRGMENV